MPLCSQVSSGVYTKTVLAKANSSTTYVANDLCDALANVTSQILWRFPGYFHHVLLIGLLPKTQYFYVYGSEEDGFSEERSFFSQPNKGGATAAFIAYGDQDWDDSSPGSPATAAFALRDILDGYNSFVLHYGDMSYGMGDVSDWDHWGKEIEPYATRAPYMVTNDLESGCVTPNPYTNNPKIIGLAGEPRNGGTFYKS